MAVNKGHTQINRNIRVGNREYKTKNATGFFNWLRAQNVTGRSILNKLKSYFVFFLKNNFPQVKYIYTPTKMVCKGKLSYLRSCILDLRKQLLMQGSTQSQQQVNNTHSSRWA